MPACQENPILYRAAREAGKAALWQRIALRLLYPAVLVGPAVYSVGCVLTASASGTLESALNTGFAISAFLALALFPLRALSGTVSAFTRERELRTLESLLASRLSPYDLFAGKMAACLRPLLVEGLLGLPIWALFVAVGAATTGQVATLHGLLAVYTLFAAVLGMWCSLRERTSLAAGGLAFGIVGGLLLAGPLLDVFLAVTHVRQGLGASAASPPMVALVTLYADVEPAATAWMAGVSAVLYLAATALLYGLCEMRLRGLQADPPAPASRTGRSPLARSLAQAWDNPVWYRHVLGNPSGGSNLGRVLRKSLVPAILIGPTLVAWFGQQGDNDYESLSQAMQVGFMVSAFGIALLFGMRALSAGGRAVAEERERRTLEPLLGTRTGPKDLLMGLLAVAVGLPALELLAWSPLVAVFSVSHEIWPGPVLGLLGFTLAVILLCGTLGLWLSSVEKMSHLAVRKAYGLLVLLTVGSLFMDGLLNEAVGCRDLFLFSRVNPFMGLVSVLTGFPRGAEGLWIWCEAAYVAAAVVFVWGTARRLARAGSR